ncbi:hypothetical protein [Actinomadura harenae]|uniref:Uncharacterized protein n=1 Tax=Actinomadura harenae TaxID=2483351 RepID=A0A3M2M9U7_9ACTN|nr:hypothetical protein [Actinomadura harenae]RMI46336.1 hypothetical protein EBO15_07160 [Actinomadura harenae]
MARRSIALLGALAAAAALTPVAAGPAQADEARHERIIVCGKLHVRDFGRVIGHECSPAYLGPLDDFVIARAGTFERFFCERGFADGWFRVEGVECRPLWF